MSEDKPADAHDESVAVKLPPGVLADLVSLTCAQLTPQARLGQLLRG